MPVWTDEQFSLGEEDNELVRDLHSLMKLITPRNMLETWHDAQQARRSIDLISKAGFDSWTIDLIYGLPEMTIAEWDEQLTISLDHGMPHLSAYCLTVEKKTALDHQVRNGLVNLPSDDCSTASRSRMPVVCSRLVDCP